VNGPASIVDERHNGCGIPNAALTTSSGVIIPTLVDIGCCWDEEEEMVVEVIPPLVGEGVAAAAAADVVVKVVPAPAPAPNAAARLVVAPSPI
jgi:hypothetical protein